MLSCNAYLSDVKSTIGTSSLSSELTIVSFADITVSSQESFDNDDDNIVLPKQNYIQRMNLIGKSKKGIKIPNQINLRQSNCYQIHSAECFIAHYTEVKLLKCASKKVAKDYKLQSVCRSIYEVIIEQKSAKLFPTLISICPRNITKLALSNIPSSIATNEARIFLDAFMDKQTQHDRETNECALKRIHLNESKNIKRKITQEYHETTSKKTFIFNSFPEMFQNNNENICNNNTKWLEHIQSQMMVDSVYNFNEIIESIEREISTIESICLPKELRNRQLAAGESIEIDDKKSAEMNAKDKFDETLQILDDLIIDICKNNPKSESHF